MKKIMTTILVMGAATCLSTQAHSAGFFIQEQSVSGLGAAFAGQAAMPRDASIMFFNPAGMTYLEGTQGNVGVHFLAPNSDIEDTGTTGLTAGDPESGNPYDIEPVPNAFISHQINDRLWTGLAITAPFGLANEYDDGWFGRYDSTSTELLTVNVQPTAAFKINDRLSIGGGVDIQYADAELKSAAFAGAEGESTLEGDDISYGYNIGMMYEATPATRLGLHYRSQINHKLDGDITVEGSGALDEAGGGEANLNLPEMATFGIAHKVTDQTTLLGGATWFGWSNFNRITATRDDGSEASNVPQEYENTWAFNAGVEHVYSPTWTFRGGVQYDQTPTTDGARSTRTPDGDRIWVSAGTTYTINPKMSLDFAATYINVGEEDISLVRNGGLSTIEGESSGDVGILAVGLNYKF